MNIKITNIRYSLEDQQPPILYLHVYSLTLWEDSPAVCCVSPSELSGSSSTTPSSRGSAVSGIVSITVFGLYIYISVSIGAGRFIHKHSIVCIFICTSIGPVRIILTDLIIYMINYILNSIFLLFLADPGKPGAALHRCPLIKSFPHNIHCVVWNT